MVQALGRGGQAYHCITLMSTFIMFTSVSWKDGGGQVGGDAGETVLAGETELGGAAGRARGGAGAAKRPSPPGSTSGGGQRATSLPPPASARARCITSSTRPKCQPYARGP